MPTLHKFFSPGSAKKKPAAASPAAYHSPGHGKEGAKAKAEPVGGGSDGGGDDEDDDVVVLTPSAEEAAGGGSARKHGAEVCGSGGKKGARKRGAEGGSPAGKRQKKVETGFFPQGK